MHHETATAPPTKRRTGPKPSGEAPRVMVSVPAPMAEPIRQLVKVWRAKQKAQL